MAGLSLLALVASSLSVLTVPGVQAGKILVFPLDGSHWINMNVMIQSLHARGHQVTVVRTATSWYIKESAPHYRSITVTLSQAMSLEEEEFYIQMLTQTLANKREGSFIGVARLGWDLLTRLWRVHQQASAMVVEMFENEALMQSLRDARYDVVLTDPGLPVGVLVAHELKLPTVYNVRWILSGEAHFAIAPSPWSYVPLTGHAASDKMTFGQRAANVASGVFNACVYRFCFSPHYDRVVARYFGPDADFYRLLQGADIWLMRVDFVFEFPRPTMPNVVYVGGFQCKPPEPLSAELEEFVQSSGEHGFILMSLGTLVKALPMEITDEIAAAFAQVPQKVIWRHVGERPANLAKNVLLVDWMPQNDLLGHSKIKAFVSHCGTNGIYEAIYHGVPIIGLPLLFDQHENLLRLETRGAAKLVDVTKITRRHFLESVRDVVQNPSYGDNMRRLSELHRDKPTRPLESAVFWTEFVMRHKGASHLRSESFRMPWYVYHSVDVVCFLVACALLLMAATVASIRFLCVRLCWRRKTKQE